MHRNDFYIPSATSTIITTNYMKAVAAGRLWAPTYNDVRMAPWRRKIPLRAEILDELLKVVEGQIPRRVIGVVRGKHEPDRRWMLNAIRTVRPDHYFFAKDYVPQAARAEDAS